MAPHLAECLNSALEHYLSKVTSVFIPFMHLLASMEASPGCEVAWSGTCEQSQQLARYLLVLLKDGLGVSPLVDFCSDTFTSLPRQGPEIVSISSNKSAKSALRASVSSAFRNFAASLPMSSGGGRIRPAVMWNLFTGSLPAPDSDSRWVVVVKVRNIFLSGGLAGFLLSGAELKAAFPDLPPSGNITNPVQCGNDFIPFSPAGLYRTLSVVAFLSNGRTTVPSQWRPVWDAVVAKMYPNGVAGGAFTNDCL